MNAPKANYPPMKGEKSGRKPGIEPESPESHSGMLAITTQAPFTVQVLVQGNSSRLMNPCTVSLNSKLKAVLRPPQWVAQESNLPVSDLQSVAAPCGLQPSWHSQLPQTPTQTQTLTSAWAFQNLQRAGDSNSQSRSLGTTCFQDRPLVQPDTRYFALQNTLKLTLKLPLTYR